MSKHDEDFGYEAFKPSGGGSAFFKPAIAAAPVVTKKLGRTYVAPPPPVPSKALGRVTDLQANANRAVTIVTKPKPNPLTALPGPVLASLPKAAAKEAVIAAAATVASPIQPSYVPITDTGGPAYQQPASGYVPPTGNYEPPPIASDEGNWSPPPDMPVMSTQTSLATAPTTSTAIVPVPKASWWTRLLAFFGIGKKSDTIHGETDLRSAVESVVRRTRNGDQNAMALMALVRDNAKKGNPRAQETMLLFQEYIRCNPVGNFGLEPNYVAMTQAVGAQWGSERLYADAVTVSHGPLLTNPRIGHFLSRFGAEEQHAIHYGLKHGNNASEHAAPSLARAIRMGKILHHARKLQAVRMHGSSFHKFDTDLGWELD